MKRLKLFALLLMLVLLPLHSDAIAQADSQYFSETGAMIQGRFLAYWQAHGGLAQFGYPLTNQFYDMGSSTHKNEGTLVQYFERARFEYHPENQPPYDVLLTLLGSQQYQQKYLAGAPNQLPSSDQPYTFAVTGKTIGGVFRRYWEQHGGLAQFGYPISDQFQETSDLDGKSYTVQYFERAVFELHPEYAGTGYEVLLTQLGTAKYKTLINNLDIRSIDVSAAGEGWAGCFGSLMLHYTEGKWLLDINPRSYSNRLVSAVQTTLPGEAWVVADAIYHYKDGNWQEAKQEAGGNIVSALAMISPNEGWAADDEAGGFFLHYTSAADKWQLPANGKLLEDSVSDIQMFSSTEGWAVGIRAFYHYQNGAWIVAQRTTPLQSNWRHISMASTSDGWVVSTVEQKLYHYDGSTWQAVDSPVAAVLWDVAMLTPSDGWAVGQGGIILHYDGTKWQPYPSPTQRNLYAIHMTSATDGWAGGDGGTILHYQNGVWSQYQF